MPKNASLFRISKKDASAVIDKAMPDKEGNIIQGNDFWEIFGDKARAHYKAKLDTGIQLKVVLGTKDNVEANILNNMFGVEGIFKDTKSVGDTKPFGSEPFGDGVGIVFDAERMQKISQGINPGCYSPSK